MKNVNIHKAVNSGVLMGKGCLSGICFKIVQCGPEETWWGYRLNEKIVEDGCMRLLFSFGNAWNFYNEYFLKKPLSQRPFLFIFANCMWFPPFPGQLWLRVVVICPKPSHSKSSALSTSQVLLMRIFFFFIV